MTKALTPAEKARRAEARKGQTALGAAPEFTVVAKTPRNGRSKQSKADKVRAAFIANPAERPSIVAKATGVDPAYVWDIREAMRRKDLIPRIDAPKSGMPRDAKKAVK